MGYSATFADLIVSIYDAALDPAAWPDALGRIASHLNADGGLFVGFSWTSQRVAIHEGIPADPVFDELYRTKYARNPWGDRAITKPVGVGFTDRELLDFGRLERTEYYQEFLRPRDIRHALFACLAGNRDFLAGTNLHRSLRRGPFEKPEMEQWQALLPHLQRAAQIQLRVEGGGLLANAALGALDRLSLGVVLLSVSGDILFVNEAAHSIVDARDGFAVDRERIVLSSRRDNDRFQKLIAAAADLGAYQPSTGGGAMVLQRPSGRLSFQLLVTPVVGRASEAVPGAAVAIFIRDAEREVDSGASWLTGAYGLTIAEGKVATLIASGLSAPQVAAQLGLSPATVRTHLAHCFAKTGVRSQVALARLLSAIAG